MGDIVIKRRNIRRSVYGLLIVLIAGNVWLGLRTYPKRDFGLYLIDSHAGVETLISGGFEHQGLLFNYRLLRLLR
ncbi:hypothetical protein CYD30_22290 [Kosakonia cowanii]|nr:hypothetical protein CYD30_22290 [Kosakonia cowanii]